MFICTLKIVWWFMFNLSIPLLVKPSLVRYKPLKKHLLKPTYITDCLVSVFNMFIPYAYDCIWYLYIILFRPALILYKRPYTINANMFYFLFWTNYLFYNMFRCNTCICLTVCILMYFIRKRFLHDNIMHI